MFYIESSPPNMLKIIRNSMSKNREKSQVVDNSSYSILTLQKAISSDLSPNDSKLSNQMAMSLETRQNKDYPLWSRLNQSSKNLNTDLNKDSYIRELK